MRVFYYRMLGCRWLVSGGADAVAAVWDLSAMACVRTCVQLDGEVKTSSTSADSRWLAYAGDQDAVVIEALQEDGARRLLIGFSVGCLLPRRRLALARVRGRPGRGRHRRRSRRAVRARVCSGFR